jgi:hypothetical protein
MKTDKDLLIKGLRYIAYTIGLMFAAPVVLHQAFKNQEHPFFWPVAIIGFILAILAVGMGFYSIKIIMDSLFSKGTKQK